MSDVDGLLDGDVAPHGQLDGALQTWDDEEGVVVLEVNGHRIDGERFDVRVRSVVDDGVGLRGRLQLGEAFDAGAGQGDFGRLRFDFVGEEGVVVAVVLNLEVINTIVAIKRKKQMLQQILEKLNTCEMHNYFAL